MDFQLSRNAFGRLVLTDAQGQDHVGVTPVRAFPLSAPGEGLSLVGPDGHELVWLDSIALLPEAARGLLEQELAVREFTPCIERLISVSSFATPSTALTTTALCLISFWTSAHAALNQTPTNPNPDVRA